jgi:hypothetical protein
MAAEREQQLRLGASLKLDAVGVSVVSGLRRHGVPAVLLKGSALARRLYRDGTYRAHDDVDLLISPLEREQAAVALAELGFERTGDADYAEPWIRREDGATIDVHVRLPGADAEPQEAWKVLAEQTRALRLCGEDVEVFADDALALHVALHAAHHGPGAAQALEDLRRALTQLPQETWRRAAVLADRISASPAFGAGLRLLAEGREVARSLGLPSAMTRETAFRSTGLPPTAPGLFRLTEAKGLGAKARLLGRELVPRVAFMRSVSPLARRGPAGLVLAYLWRPLWLAGHAPAAWKAVRRARRAAPP